MGKFNLDEVVSKVKRIGISGHVNPDGDCVGSTLGLYNYIRTYFKDVEVRIFLGDIPEVFKFLKNSDKIEDAKAYDGENFDLFFALDCADAARLGDAGRLFKNAGMRACIDHHLSNSSVYDINYIIPDDSSTCELVCSLIDEEKITKEIAECLYTGMVHDTGVFQYSCTSSETMRRAGMLMNKGIDYPWIVQSSYYEKTYNQNLLLGRALSKAKLYDGGKIVATVISGKDFEECGCTKKDTEGIVSQLRITKDTDAAIFLYQNEDGTHKASLRTAGTIDLSKIAKTLGGGGHQKAAGATVGKDSEKELHRIIDMIIAERDGNGA